MSEIVSKNGEGGSKKDKSLEAMKKRAKKAIEGAKRYKSQQEYITKQAEAAEENRQADMKRSQYNSSFHVDNERSASRE